MSRLQKILGGLLLVLIAVTAALLLHMKAHQRLGDPGVKTRPIADSKRLEVLLPEALPGYTSEILTNSEVALQILPDDTSFRVRLYRANDGFISEMSVVLMGSDRSSIHAPQICLTGQGWVINDAKTSVENIPLDRPFSYELPVNKLIATKEVKDADGNAQVYSGVYLYWFVDADQYTASEWRRKVWLVPRDLLMTGVLDRWAYIACFSACLPGQEAATYGRMEKMIADTVPEFQLVPRAAR